MTTAAAKVRYQHNDQATYAHVLECTLPLSAFPQGRVSDPVLYKQACWEATIAVPLNDAPAGAFNREAYVRQRLHEAIVFRDKWYLDRLPAEGRA